MAKLITLKDKDENILYPIVKIDSILDNNGDTIFSLSADNSLIVSRNLCPIADKTFNIGSTGSFYKNCYCENGNFITGNFVDNVYALGFYETSDEKLKDFKNDLYVDFDQLKKIPKKYFTWKKDENQELNIGTSAQEIQKIYPELVSDNDGILTVDYAKLSIIALAAIDKLNAKIEELEVKLNKLS